MKTPQPSVAFGLRRTVELWRVVLAVFVASMAVVVPIHMVLWFALGEAMLALPQGELPEGELLLITVELVRPVLPVLLASVVFGRLLLWAWTVVWHAGLVRWFVYSGRRDARLAEILSRGLMGWWRWARLGLTAVAGVACGLAMLLFVHGRIEQRAFDTGDDSLLGIALVATLSIAALFVALSWAATLRAAWLLGDAGRRSAAFAWFAGLRDTVRRPLSSILTLVVWMLPGTAFSALPVLVGATVEFCRGGVVGVLVSAAAGVLAAFCWVGLFMSFAPVTGLSRTSAPSTAEDGS